MRLPHPIILLLIAACVLLDACAWSAHDPQTFTVADSLFLVTVVSSQVGLLAIWTTIGPGLIWSRLSVAAAIAVLTLLIASSPGGTLFSNRAVTFSIVHFGTIATMLTLVRLFGRRLASPQELTKATGQTSSSPKWQFSIADLLKMTAAWAICFAAVRRLPSWGDRQMLEMSMTGMVALMLAFPIPAIVFLIFYPIPLVARIALMVMANSFAFTIANSAPDRMEVAVVIVGSQLLVGAALLCVYAAGYRLIRTPDRR